MSQLPVAIIGGGPVGLAAAVHLLERGEEPIVFEAGETVGASVLDWRHVRMFSPWEFNVDAACVRLLESAGWAMPLADDLPTGAELVGRYLRPLAALPEMRERIQTATRVTAISRRYLDKLKDRGRNETPFQLHIATGDGEDSLVEARAVVDASGTWLTPNPLGANGLPAFGESSLSKRIFYGIPDVIGRDRERFIGRRVIVVGSGHSAINTLLDLINLRDEHPQTEIVWVMRSGNLQKVYGGGEGDALPARGQLGMRIEAAVNAGALQIVAPFAITHVDADGYKLRLHGETNGADLNRGRR